ncbi:MAG: hypothetical protein RR374_04995, partial [Clostridia bacterium]
VVGTPYIAKGRNNCLHIYAEDYIEGLKAKLQNIPQSDLEAQKAVTSLLSSFIEIEEDNQGRFTFPADFREYAHMEKDVVFKGAGRYIEVWAKELAEAQEMSYEETMASLAKYGV